MKVYVKKEDKNSKAKFITIMGILSLVFTTIIFINFLNKGKSFIDIIKTFDITPLITIIFYGFGLCCFGSLIKSPKAYKATLVSKEIENYNGQKITYMTFEVQTATKEMQQLIPSQYKCYTLGENNLIIGNEYSLKIKEVNWEPKYVDDFVNQIKIANSTSKISMMRVFYIFVLIFGTIIFFCIANLIMRPNHYLFYIIGIIFCSLALCRAYKISKMWEEDNGNIKQDEEELILELSKIKPLYNTQEKIDNINITDNIDITNLKHFNIFRPTTNAIFPQYFITDQNENLIFKIKKSSFMDNKYIICNRKDVIIGEIESKKDLAVKYYVNIINESPFIVRAKMQLNSNYQIIGRDYYVKGDIHFIRNVIFNKQSNAVAFISATSKDSNNKYQLGNTEIILNDQINNSIDIIMIALCITMGNFRLSDIRTN